MLQSIRERIEGALGLLLFSSGSAHAEYGLNFPKAVSEGARQIYDIHMLTLGITTVLMVIVTLIVGYSVWNHRKSQGYVADQTFHETWFGRWGWLSVPVLVLGLDLSIAGSAQTTLERIWTVPNGEKTLDIKVTGHQWWWEYDYLDHDLNIESRAEERHKAGRNYFREVDNPLVLPTGTRVRFLHTSADVIHAFWVPSLGFKKDAIPGYVTETWAEIDEEGIYRGQCAELCGTWHSRMPVVVKALSPGDFAQWIAERKEAKRAAAAEADTDKQWSKTELFARGKETYNTKCSACHKETGEGMPPTFPPLKGSKVVLGEFEKHVNIVLNGVPDTAMQPWNQLTDLEIAALLTYERNAWGNDTGDVIQPAMVAAERSGTQSAAR